MFFRRILNDPIPRYAWRRVLNLWKPMAAWSLLVWISVAIILVPLFSSLLGWSFFRGDQLVVGNTELINWIFTPFGFMYGVLTATLALIGGMIRYAGLFQIVTDDLKGTPVSVRGTALRIAPLVPKLFRLSFMVILAGAVILLPLMAGLGGIYWHFLGDHDINYYLSVHPPELNRAMIVGGIWVAIWFMGAGWILCRSLLILPAFLFGESDIREAVKESWGLSQYQSHRLLALMGLSIGLWVVTSLAVDAFILFSASFVIEWVATVSTSLRPIVFVTGLYAVITLAGSAIIGFIGFSLSATVLTKFYYESIGVRIGTNSQNVSRYLPARTLVIARYWLSTARIIPLVMVLITGSLVLSTVMLERIPEQHPVEIFAHRGGPSPAPENTVAAVEEAIAAGADYAEIDVQNSQDSVVVLLHDIDMMRVSGDSREIAHTDYSDLEDSILSSDEGSPSGEHIPATLDEVLQRADRRIKLMIELKYYG
ncbi:MAG: glycerophosphodiester phosphodiesterase family protein, partial [Balneolales bacterium]